MTMTGNEYKQKLLTDAAFRNHIKNCPMCGQSVEDRVITIYEDLIDQLYAIYCWCGEKKRHEFTTKEIKHLLNHNGYARFGDFVKCSGGILYRPEVDGKTTKGVYGLNMARAKAFFRGEREMPMQVSLNQLTNEKRVLRTAKIGDFPTLTALLNEKGLYDHERLF